ncbi:GlxA family transcriptional regulator [Bradyrhizobium sp. LA2.1]|uniref:GlxA family transcriptional regulator n=1 Tax=Bradyrhizobium sp. LA2.1 TaxID=3156376 RepID=UPI0033994597
MQRVGFLLSPGFQVTTLAVLSVFEGADFRAGELRYNVRMISKDGGPVRSSSGLMVETEKFRDPKFDTLIVCGNILLEMRGSDPAVVEFVRSAAKVSRRTASVCTGAFILGDAGLLDGRRATTHWGHAQNFKARFPNVTLDEDRIFIVDGNIWTSAGGTAGIDLALAMVEEDAGADVARYVAKLLVVYHRRSGGQFQRSALLELEPKSDRIQSALAFVKKNLNSTISVEQLASVANLSTRHFSRAFQSETGLSPAKAIEKLRIEAARLMIEEGRHSIETVAKETGFADRERMRRAFVRALGQSPQEFRRRTRSETSA